MPRTGRCENEQSDEATLKKSVLLEDILHGYLMSAAAKTMTITTSNQIIPFPHIMSPTMTVLTFPPGSSSNPA
jgi:hypothetical protein